MSDFILSTNMNLPIPIVGQDPGPDYAENINNSLTLVDQHNHSVGSGVQVTPAGLNISSDLTFLNNNATALRTVRWQSQSAPLSLPNDLNCAYVSGVDLYYNDGNGNQIRLTQSGSIVGTAGSITGLVPPASASYVSGSETFVWQSDVNKPANMDFGYAIFRNNVANSKGLTLSPPNSMGADYTITLPALPSVTKLLTIDNSGNIGTQAYGDYQISASCGVVLETSATPVDVTNLTVTITTTGRPVFVGLISDASGSPGYVGVSNASGGSTSQGNIQITDSAGTTVYADNIILISSVGSTPVVNFVPPSSVSTLLQLSAGTYTFKVRAANNSGSVGVITHVVFCKLVAYET